MNTGELTNYPEDQIINDPAQIFFDRPGEEVISQLAPNWSKYGEKDIEYPGSERGAKLIIENEGIMRYFTIEEAQLYSHDDTMKRWKNTRGPAISAMIPGTLFAYNFRTSVLTFLKTQGAENIQLKRLSEVDEFGEQKENGEIVTTGKTGGLFGLDHEGQTSITMLEGEIPTFVVKKEVRSSSS